jgi:hypothetical protein
VSVGRAWMVGDSWIEEEHGEQGAKKISISYLRERGKHVWAVERATYQTSSTQSRDRIDASF